MRILLVLVVSLAFAYGTPVERKSNGPLVVDVPAGMFDETEDIAPAPSSQNKDVEIIQPSSDSVEEVEGVNNKKPESNEDGIIPTILIIRRPMITDRFPFFQSESPFQGFRPFSLFENRRRPLFEVQNQKPSSDDSDDGENTHDMLSHMEQMMKRMQQQMSSLWGSFLSPSFQRRPLRPIFPSLIDSGEIDNSNETTVFNIENLPANYTNSTSETKVVDGHVVQVNKTIHKISSGNNNSGFFHFEVINVRPTGGTKTDTPVVPEASDAKPFPEIQSTSQPEQPKVEDPSLNEVGGGTKRNSEDNTFPFLVNRRRQYYDRDDDENSEVEWIPRTDYEYQRPWTLPRSRSLDHDLKINRIVNRGGHSPFLQIHPDVELI